MNNSNFILDGQIFNDLPVVKDEHIVKGPPKVPISTTSIKQAMIYDELGAVPDVHIFNKTKGTGTITNINGAFKIEASENDIIEITHQSYATKVVKASEIKGLMMIVQSSNVLDSVHVTSRKGKIKMFLLLLALGTAGYFMFKETPEKAIL